MVVILCSWQGRVLSMQTHSLFFSIRYQFSVTLWLVRWEMSHYMYNEYTWGSYYDKNFTPCNPCTPVPNLFKSTVYICDREWGRLFSLSLGPPKIGQVDFNNLSSLTVSKGNCVGLQVMLPLLWNLCVNSNHHNKKKLQVALPLKKGRRKPL